MSAVSDPMEHQHKFDAFNVNFGGGDENSCAGVGDVDSENAGSLGP